MSEIDKQSDRIEKLIRIIEKEFTEKRAILRLAGHASLIIINILPSFFLLLLGIALIGIAELELKDLITIIIASAVYLLSIGGYLNILHQISGWEEAIFDTNYDKMKNKVSEDERIVMEALLRIKIRSRALRPKDRLLRLYKKYPSIFKEEDLIRKTCQLPSSI